jgi:alpha-beta hydrolase superfamily lysophospholipase
METIIFLVLILLALYACILVIYYFLQDRLLFVATPLKLRHSFQLASSFEEVYLASDDGGKIHALLIHATDSKGLILYFHGNTGNMSRWSVVAEELTTYGFNVLVVDYRGFGKSEGRRNEKNLNSDAQVIYDHAKTLCPESKLIVYGRSLGTGLAVKVASDNNPWKLVLETPYFHLPEVAFYHFPFIPVKWLLRFKFRSDKVIHKVTCPIAIFHGTRDRIVPYSSGLKLYELIGDDPKHTMVTIPRGKHSNLGSYPLFREKMRDFLEKGL